MKLNDQTTRRISETTREDWPQLGAVGRVVSTRPVKGKTTTQQRYCLLNDAGVKKFAQAARDQ